jgi:hypothetical protein
MPQMRAYDADAASEAYDTYASDEGFRCWSDTYWQHNSLSQAF